METRLGPLGKQMTNPIIEEFCNQYKEQQKQKTGISGYCICCGTPLMLDGTQQHDTECIWWEEDFECK